ncbi:DUF4231 domain-containing protein [Rhodococcus sp. KBW08]|uniref:DUF4231 domain-containing protein n=1 Tax=Rhodococcus sp. KBW08 TaxID=2144188 RepID=UPI000F5A3DB5|nr:DUF4231 domain-containing protein [Rhodococcus sp. KBW08]
MTKKSFRIINGLCMAAVVVGVMLPIMVKGGSSGIIGWSIALIALVIWLSSAFLSRRNLRP